MQAIHQQLQDTLSVLHRKSIDADRALDQLQQSQQGKFAAIFASDSPFTTNAKRFGPYVEEIASDWQALKDMDEDTAKQALPLLVTKIELALRTLSQFQETLKKG
ncbi:hypothetical protein [Alteromonas halophila]|uniref:Prephenate dehydrogenase n=1 Tax=Alteromonas halophila TaxID=516698 RepID=A0A918JGR1_9ALTE|nr:hypothetical protein [Alteromonas halophila]GGW80224.1 hypothetical protein GCM10007391_11350 [Alteromonas halophila]